MNKCGEGLWDWRDRLEGEVNGVLLTANAIICAPACSFIFMCRRTDFVCVVVMNFLGRCFTGHDASSNSTKSLCTKREVKRIYRHRIHYHCW